MTILIVDDSRTMRMIIRRTLRQAGYDFQTVYEASNGVEALSAINDSEPDVVLCDWNMPEMSGIDVLNTLRQKGEQVKFGFVTSESTEEMRSRALEAGADFFVSKPFTAETLQNALDPILNA